MATNLKTKIFWPRPLKTSELFVWVDELIKKLTEAWRDVSFTYNNHLVNDEHSQYALLAGRSGGQILEGGIDSGDDLKLISTDHATKGSVFIGGDGGSTNYSEFEADGTLKFVGSATIWEDLRVPGISVKLGSTAPDFAAFGPSGNLLTYAFDGASLTEQVYFTVQMPHSYKQGSDIYPHVHWTPTDTNTGNVVWQLEYSWANIGGTFAAPSTIATTAQAAGGTAWVHKMAVFPAISGTGKNISSQLICRLFRNPGHTDDTYAHDASFIEFDIHFEADTVGSRTETAK